MQRNCFASPTSPVNKELPLSVMSSFPYAFVCQGVGGEAEKSGIGSTQAHKKHTYTELACLEPVRPVIFFMHFFLFYFFLCAYMRFSNKFKFFMAHFIFIRYIIFNLFYVSLGMNASRLMGGGRSCSNMQMNS